MISQYKYMYNLTKRTVIFDLVFLDHKGTTSLTQRLFVCPCSLSRKLFKGERPLFSTKDRMICFPRKIVK